MPCGGIYPALLFSAEPCFTCDKQMNGNVLAVEEWDAAIHVGCLRSFLGTQEAEIIRDHQHPIITETDGVLYKKLLCFSPELSMSDWALCSIDEEGDEVVVSSYSRMEYVDGRR